MSHTHKRVPMPPNYSPDVDRREPPRRGRWFQSVSLSEFLTALALLSALLSALGWRYYSPALIESRVTAVEHRVDTLSSDLKFTNYLQCVQLRKTDPMSLPPGCAPIIERGTGKP